MLYWSDSNACHTQERIAEEINIDRSRVAQIVVNVKNRIRAEINDDPPDCLQLYNRWSFSRCDPEAMKDLRKSIEELGIVQPIVVRKTDESNGEGS